MGVSRKKAIVYIAALVLFVALICIAIYLKSVLDYKKAVSNISFDEIAISDVSDGVYMGECDVDFIYAKVEVVVENGKITDIGILEHKNERGESAEVVIDRIYDEQKIDVDTVSGATNSSKVLKKAVENALKKVL